MTVRTARYTIPNARKKKSEFWFFFSHIAILTFFPHSSCNFFFINFEFFFLQMWRKKRQNCEILKTQLTFNLLFMLWRKQASIVHYKNITSKHSHTPAACKIFIFSPCLLTNSCVCFSMALHLQCFRWMSLIHINMN